MPATRRPPAGSRGFLSTVPAMATVVLLRHGRTTANTSGILAGRSPGVVLDELGVEQAARAAERLAPVPLATVVTSPLERCVQTARAVAGQQPGRPKLQREKGIAEVDYGVWTGKELKALAKEQLWRGVQGHPAGVTFPEGESMAGMSARSVEAVRRWDRRGGGGDGGGAGRGGGPPGGATKEGAPPP